MGRKSTFEDADIYSAVGEQIAIGGQFTLHGLSQSLGISTGSIYHRFSSREALLAQTWLDAVRSFQAKFLDALANPVREAGEHAALVTPRFCRANPRAAVVLASCRQEEFIGDETPDDLRTEIASVNEAVATEFKRFARRVGKPLLECQLAIVAYPLAAVRIYLPHKKVPRSIDAHILKAYRATMASGEDGCKHG